MFCNPGCFTKICPQPTSVSQAFSKFLYILHLQHAAAEQHCCTYINKVLPRAVVGLLFGKSMMFGKSKIDVALYGTQLELQWNADLLLKPQKLPKRSTITPNFNITASPTHTCCLTAVILLNTSVLGMNFVYKMISDVCKDFFLSVFYISECVSQQIKDQRWHTAVSCVFCCCLILFQEKTLVHMA